MEDPKYRIFIFFACHNICENGENLKKKLICVCYFCELKSSLLKKIQNRISLYLKICDLKEVAKEPKTGSPRKFPDIRYNEEV